MNKSQTQLIRVYKRQSKSPWDDHSTVLLLADHQLENNEVQVSFNKYIYLHRNVQGQMIGISISKSLLEENAELESQYLTGIEAYMMLLIYIDDIAAFCERFRNEFKSIFGVYPHYYFETAEQCWSDLIIAADAL
ncbi:hypothetical protein A9267_10950 [Shewanella sp. UCD-FRSSP16_17]|uniref:hypothetical protein n=1 Tax=Shewanella sp. UCD-FRSSP16_17 TaxID=1853256 RepID=UPI0007EEBB21|nr:hypothetical protein [Shewanella sp. UCD-FRSSP16_17]OBT08227.1 hypothetical protein A9267_10950 [Shewanella sp. UCD-FRSSP16_17]